MFLKWLNHAIITWDSLYFTNTRLSTEKWHYKQVEGNIFGTHIFHSTHQIIYLRIVNRSDVPNNQNECGGFVKRCWFMTGSALQKSE